MHTTTPRAGRPSLSGSTGESPQIRFRVNSELRAQLDALADATGQTVSEITRIAVAEYVARQPDRLTTPKPKKAGRPKARFYIEDRAKSQDAGLANFRSYFNERYWIIDRTTGKCVDEANTQYEARQALAMAKIDASKETTTQEG